MSGSARTHITYHKSASCQVIDFPETNRNSQESIAENNSSVSKSNCSVLIKASSHQKRKQQERSNVIFFPMQSQYLTVLSEDSYRAHEIDQQENIKIEAVSLLMRAAELVQSLNHTDRQLSDLIADCAAMLSFSDENNAQC
jgi:hypothetical protein